jgi:hypothetical protein
MEILRNGGRNDIWRPFHAWHCAGLATLSRDADTTWALNPDSNAGQTVLTEYKGSNVLSRVTWFRGNDKYHEAAAMGAPMNNGVWLFAAGESYVETYVLNVSTSELLFTSIRSGGQALPNAVKAFRGVCVGAAN